MAKITAAAAEKWHQLNARRLELDREARALEKERDLLSVEFKEALEADDKESVVRGRFRIALADGRPHVSWKDEFVRALGAELANAIAKRAEAPKKIHVEVVKAA